MRRMKIKRSPIHSWLQSMRPTVIHNNYTYSIDIKRFAQLSTKIKEIIENDHNIPIFLEDDSLDEDTFSLFSTAVNTPNFFFQPANVIQILKAAFIYKIHSFVSEAAECIIKANQLSLVKQALAVSVELSECIEDLERHISKNLCSYSQDQEFLELPAYLMYRICTWYEPINLSESELYSFIISLVSIHGSAATPFFFLADLSNFPSDILFKLISNKQIDTDIIGPTLMEALTNRQEPVENAEEIRNSISLAKSEKDRILPQCESAERRKRATQLKYEEVLKKHDALLHEYQDNDISFKETLSENDKIKAQLQELEKRKAEALLERDNMKKKRDIAYNSLTGKVTAAAAAAQKASKAAAAAKKVTPARPVQQQKPPEPVKSEPEPPAPQPEPEPEPAPIPEPEPETEKEQEVKPIITKPQTLEKPAIPFVVENFEKNLAMSDVQLSIIPTETLKSGFTDTGDARIVFLDYLWRYVELKDPDACSSYAALLAANDTYCDDLVVNLLEQAVKRGNLDAMYNLGVMFHFGRGIAANDKASSKLFVEAANQGHIPSVKLAKQVCNL